MFGRYMGAEGHGNDQLAAVASEANREAILVAGPKAPKASEKMAQRIAKFDGKSRREALEGMTPAAKASVRKELDQLLANGYLECMSAETKVVRLQTPRTRVCCCKFVCCKTCLENMGRQACMIFVCRANVCRACAATWLL